MIGAVFFISWRIFELLTLIPTMGILAYFVNIYNSANQLTPASILTLFITSVLAVAWCFFTLFRIGSVRRNAHFIALIELGFMGAFIASAYELRGIASADCVQFDGGLTTTTGPDSITVSYSSPSVTADKVCSMLKAAFAFAIINAIAFPVTAFIVFTMRRPAEYREEVVVTRRHGSRRGHSSHSGRSRRSSSSRRNYYV